MPRRPFTLLRRGGRAAAAAARFLRERFEEFSPAYTALFIIGIYFFFFLCYFNCADFCPTTSACTPLDLREFLKSYRLPGAGEPPLPTPVEKALLWPGRLMWVFATVVNFLAVLAAYFYCLHLIGKSRRGGRRGAGRHLLWGCAGVALIFCVARATGSRWFMPQLHDLLSTAATTDLPDAIFITYFTLLVGVAAAGLFVWASCAVIQGARRERTPLALAERMRTLRTLLYVAAASLVTTVLRLSMTFKWSLATLPSGPGGSGREGAVKLMDDFASSFIAVQAGAYSLILAAAYVPAAIVLSKRALELAVGHYDTLPKRDEWLKLEGLSETFLEHLPRVGAILAPLLVGPLGDALGKLAGAK